MIPNIYKNEIFWEGSIRLDYWSKYFEEDLKITLNIGGDCIIDKVTALHEKGYNYLIAEQSDILQTVVEAIFEKYPIWQDEYGYKGEYKGTSMPDISNKQELIQLIHPYKIYIMDVEKQGMPYIGIEFTCKWDEDHGVGLMLYNERVVEIGGADIAFMSWIAEEDIEK